MLIFHADDEALVRELVVQSLSLVGHQVFSLDSSDSREMTVDLIKLLERFGEPDIFILDGYNTVQEATGKILYETTPLGISDWLRQHGFKGNCRFILYSNDDKLVNLAKTTRHLNFVEAVAKVGPQGGLVWLFKAVQVILPQREA